MANTSLNLGEHWEVFIKNEVASGHYGSASEVVRDALRNLEKHKARLNALRSHLAEGAAQAARGEFASESLQDMLQDFRKSPLCKASIYEIAKAQHYDHIDRYRTGTSDVSEGRTATPRHQARR